MTADTRGLVGTARRLAHAAKASDLYVASVGRDFLQELADEIERLESELARLRQEQGEPVAWRIFWGDTVYFTADPFPTGSQYEWEPLYSGALSVREEGGAQPSLSLPPKALRPYVDKHLGDVHKDSRAPSREEPASDE